MNPDFTPCGLAVEMKPRRRPEFGAAHIRIELTGGMATVYHGDGPVLKGPFPVTEGYWDRLWEAASKDISQP